MDERLRALERAWTQSREEGDELRLVRERLRTGALRLAHLEVGAFLGSPVAQELTPVILVSPGVRFGSREWSVALYRRFGPHLTRRFELGLLRSFLPTWRRLTPNDDLFPRLLDRMGRYLLDPTQRAALAQVLDEDPSEVEAELRLSRCRERRFNGNVEVNVGAFLLPPTQQHRRLLGDLICNCPDHIALTLAHSYAERQLLEPPLEPADYGGSALLEAMRSPRVSYQHDFDQALARATQELLNWCLGHEEPFGPKRKLLLSPTPNPAPSLEVSQEHLLQLERAAEQTPADLETLRELVRASEAAGWRHGRYTMQDYRKLLRIAGTRAEDTATGRTVASLGLRAVPLALDALPSPVACRALQHLGERALAAVPRLVELLSHPESEVRRDSVRVLEAIGPSHALEPVRRALGQSEYVHAPLYLLLAFGEDPAPLEPYLRRAFANGRYGQLLLHPRAEVLAPVVDLLTELALALESRGSHPRAAIKALARLGPAGVPALERVQAEAGGLDGRRELAAQLLAKLRKD